MKIPRKYPDCAPLSWVRMCRIIGRAIRPRPKVKRYPLSALVRASGMSEAALARQVGLSGTSLTKARDWGLVEDAADRYACRLNLIPHMVWGDWQDDHKIPCPECGTRFVPVPNQRRCSRRCRTNASSREWKRRNAERNRTARRAYYELHGDYERSRQRRYDQTRAA